MSTSRAIATIAFTGLLFSWLLEAPILIDWLNRNEKEQVAKAHLASLRRQLYVPQSVTVLQETEEVTYPNSFDGRDYDCFGADVTIVYGTNQSRTEIRQAYAQALSAAKWASDPGYKLTEGYAVYSKGKENQLAITTHESVPNPTRQNFNVIYSVRLEYLVPSEIECRG